MAHCIACEQWQVPCQVSHVTGVRRERKSRSRPRAISTESKEYRDRLESELPSVVRTPAVAGSIDRPRYQEGNQIYIFYGDANLELIYRTSTRARVFKVQTIHEELHKSQIDMSSSRIFPRISLQDFDKRRSEILQELVEAATGPGFFIVVDHGLSVEEINHMFGLSQKYFALPDDIKAKNAFVREKNVGWEKQAQIRPSTGTPDQKESLQLQFGSSMEGKWPTDVPNFKKEALEFMSKVQLVSLRIMSCFAEALGLPLDFFDQAHDVTKDDSLTVLRCLHYHDITGQTFPDNYWRAGAHTDFDVLTLLFQRPGEGGLEVCPGREANTSFGWGDTWYPVEPEEGAIVCNIGDMLMYISDDKYKSNFHRVRTPKVGENQKPRYSMAYFNQASKSTVVKGNTGLYPELTGEEFIAQAMKRNYDAALLRKANEAATIARPAHAATVQAPQVMVK
ncbi:hypothetical protein MRB53_037080 [Persea americana]|nr:hypothetical protein MRB53_037080 [Persea americana]